jgi:hypothetical protein
MRRVSILGLMGGIAVVSAYLAGLQFIVEEGRPAGMKVVAGFGLLAMTVSLAAWGSVRYLASRRR